MPTGVAMPATATKALIVAGAGWLPRHLIQQRPNSVALGDAFFADLVEAGEDAAGAAGGEAGALQLRHDEQLARYVGVDVDDLLFQTGKAAQHLCASPGLLRYDVQHEQDACAEDPTRKRRPIWL